MPVPLGINPPANVAPPPENVIFTNIHNTTIINTTIVANPAASAGPDAAGVAAGVAAGAAAGAIAAKVALPPSVVRKGSLMGGQGAPGLNPSRPRPGTPPGAAGAGLGTRPPAGHELLGVSPGKPLPPEGSLGCRLAPAEALDGDDFG